MCVLTKGVRTVLGYLCSFAVTISIVLTIVSGQLLGDKISSMEINAIRSCCQFIISTAILGIYRTDPRFSLKRCELLVLSLSAISGWFSGQFLIVALWYLPAAVTEAMTEIVIICLAAVYTLFTGQCEISLVLAVLTCICGTFCMFQPDFIFHNVNPYPSNRSNDVRDVATLSHNISSANFSGVSPLMSDSEKMSGLRSHQQAVGILAIIGTGVSFWIVEQMAVPFLVKNKNITVNVIFFWISLGSAILSVPLMFLATELVVLPNGFDVAMLLVVISSQILTCYCMMVAVSFITPIYVSVVLPFSVVFLFIIQKTLLRDIAPGPGNWLEKFGLSLLLFGTLILPVYELITYRMKIQNSDDEEKPIIENSTGEKEY